jgi:hypothetical protein
MERDRAAKLMLFLLKLSYGLAGPQGGGTRSAVSTDNRRAPDCAGLAPMLGCGLLFGRMETCDDEPGPDTCRR